MAVEQRTVDIQLGTPVYDVDGERVGSAAALVLSPAHDVATHLVVEMAGFVPSERVVPLDAVTAVNAERVQLRLRSDEILAQPELKTRSYTLLETPEGEFAPNLPSTMPRMVKVSLADEMTPPLSWMPGYVDEQRGVPPCSPVVREGMPVRDQANQQVGRVTELMLDADTGALLSVAVRLRGRGRHLKAIPVEWIEASDEDTGIKLAVDGPAVEGLPDIG